MSDRAPLTAIQASVLDIIAQSVNERGFPPTVREIAAARGGRSTNAVNDVLVALEKKGHITRDKNKKSRSIHLVGVEPIDTTSHAALTLTEGEMLAALCVAYAVAVRDKVGRMNELRKALVDLAGRNQNFAARVEA